MNGLNIIDYLFLYSLLSTWVLLLMNIVLSLSGYKFFTKINKQKIDILKELTVFPSISVLIPAHNEEVVIERTVKSILSLDYPKNKIEIIVINDY